MVSSQEYSFIGWVTETQNKNKNYRPFAVGMKDANNQRQWFSTFDAKVGQMLESAGINSGPWNIQYVMKPWVGDDNIERFNYHIITITGSQGAPQVPMVHSAQTNPTPPSSPQAPPAPPQDPVPPPQPSPSVPNWATNLDDRGRSIIRQVAFKDVQNKDDKSLEEIARLTDAYEAILLCSFEPEPVDEFIQQAF